MPSKINLTNAAIEKIERYKKDTIEQALKKLKAKRQEHLDNLNTTGYDRYYNLMRKYEEEIEELEEYRAMENRHTVAALRRNCELYREQLRTIKRDLKAKMVYIKATYPDSADIRNLSDYINDIEA